MNSEAMAFWAPRTAAIVAIAALLSALLIVTLRPLLARYTLARPNARSSHIVPTPQGGGIAIVAATIAVSCGAFFLWPVSAANITSPAVLIAAVVLLSLIHI